MQDRKGRFFQVFVILPKKSSVRWSDNIKASGLAHFEGYAPYFAGNMSSLATLLKFEVPNHSEVNCDTLKIFFLGSCWEEILVTIGKLWISAFYSEQANQIFDNLTIHKNFANALAKICIPVLRVCHTGIERNGTKGLQTGKRFVSASQKKKGCLHSNGSHTGIVITMRNKI